MFGSDWVRNDYNSSIFHSIKKQNICMRPVPVVCNMHNLVTDLVLLPLPCCLLLEDAILVQLLEYLFRGLECMCTL